MISQRMPIATDRCTGSAAFECKQIIASVFQSTQLKCFQPDLHLKDFRRKDELGYKDVHVNVCNVCIDT